MQFYPYFSVAIYLLVTSSIPLSFHLIACVDCSLASCRSHVVHVAAPPEAAPMTANTRDTILWLQCTTRTIALPHLQNRSSSSQPLRARLAPSVGDDLACGTLPVKPPTFSPENFLHSRFEMKGRYFKRFSTTLHTMVEYSRQTQIL